MFGLRKLDSISACRFKSDVVKRFDAYQKLGVSPQVLNEPDKDSQTRPRMIQMVF